MASDTHYLDEAVADSAAAKAQILASVRSKAPVSREWIDKIESSVDRGTAWVKRMRLRDQPQPFQRLATIVDNCRQSMDSLLSVAGDASWPEGLEGKADMVLDLLDGIVMAKLHVRTLRGNSAASTDLAWQSQQVAELRIEYSNYAEGMVELLSKLKGP